MLPGLDHGGEALADVEHGDPGLPRPAAGRPGEERRDQDAARQTPRNAPGQQEDGHPTAAAAAAQAGGAAACQTGAWAHHWRKTMSPACTAWAPSPRGQKGNTAARRARA